MPALPPGPFETLDVGGGVQAPVYLIPFDKRGRVKAPQTRAHLVTTAQTGGHTHIFLFSHGWNNDFATALGRYRSFFGEFKAVREQHGGLATYRPLLVGVIWPSTAMVLPSERPPQMAAIGDDPVEQQANDADSFIAELDEIAQQVPDDQVERFLALATSQSLDQAQARELAAILRPIYAAPEDTTLAEDDEAPSVDDIVDDWKAVAGLMSDTPEDPDADEEEFGGGAFGGGGAAAPDAAGLLDFLDPRPALRSLTVWKMKDRAGVVGTRGVGPLLADLIAAAPTAAVHLIGHSYGAKVVLSAANALPANTPVESALLLQPAINGYAFSANVAGKGFRGGYRRVLSIVKQPIMSTFSRHDGPLTKMFHLAVRRKRDLGEVQVAAGAPSRFAALGGFGPRGLGVTEGIEIRMPGNGEPYPPFNDPVEIVGLKGDAHIGGHGDVTTAHTAWALLHQVKSAS